MLKSTLFDEKPFPVAIELLGTLLINFWLYKTKLIKQPLNLFFIPIIMSAELTL